jgi:hypothetical protein
LVTVTSQPQFGSGQRYCNTSPSERPDPFLGRAHREVDKRKVGKHQKLAKASAGLAQAAELLLQSTRARTCRWPRRAMRGGSPSQRLGSRPWG